VVANIWLLKPESPKMKTENGVYANLTFGNDLQRLIITMPAGSMQMHDAHDVISAYDLVDQLLALANIHPDEISNLTFFDDDGGFGIDEENQCYFDRKALLSMKTELEEISIRTMRK
jgi:hypothetical protein